ncbi:MAG: hypothetical protein ACRDLA_07425 [Thermoleophilaceae bacterium]
MAESVAGIELPDGDPGAVGAAASGLRSTGGGFENARGTVARAAAGVPSWSGHASFAFANRCGTYGSAARSADSACEQAAGALRRYGTVLSEARGEVRRLQRLGEACVTEMEQAEARAAEASERHIAASRMAYQASFGSAADAGATAAAFRVQADDAIGDRDRALGEAQRAREELERLRDKAERERDRVLRAGRTAAGEVQAATASMPSVSWPATGIGGTVISSRGETVSVGVRILIFKLGGSESALVEERADGTWAVTLADGLEGGIEADLMPGAETGGTGETGRIGAGPDLQAALLAQYENGETFEFESRQEAMTFLEMKNSGPPIEDPYAPSVNPTGGYVYPSYLAGLAAYKRDWHWAQDQEPEESYEEGGIKATAGASFDFGTSHGAGLEAEGSETLGRRVDLQTGANTVYYQTTVSANGGLAVPGASGGGEVRGESVTAVTFTGEDGRQVSGFSVSSTASGHYGGGLDADLKHASVGAEESHGIRRERQVQLDMTIPENREALNEYLASGGADPGAVAELNERMRESGHTIVRVYETGSTSNTYGVDVKAIGGEAGKSTSASQLTELRYRPPGADEFIEVPIR